MNSPKRTKIASDYYELLDADLAAWRGKLQKTSSNDSNYNHKLVFYSKRYCGTVLREFPSYGPLLSEEWSAKEWHETRENAGPVAIAFSYSAQALTPPPLSAQRLQLFGFSYVICPTNIKLPDSLEELRLSVYKHYLYGCPGLFDPSQRKLSLEIVDKQLDIENSKHVQEAYDYMNIVNTSLAIERPLLMQLEHLEREYKEKKKLLFAMIRTVNDSRRNRIVSKQN